MNEDLNLLWHVAFRASYAMSGQFDAAEDVAQETLARWLERASEDIASPRSYVARMATNRTLDEFRRIARDPVRSGYGPLPDLPAPAPVPEGVPDLSYALIVALERLTPLERAVFLLRDGFDCAYREIGETLGRSAAAMRQAYQRARRVLREGRDGVSEATVGAEAFAALLSAIEDGDLGRVKAEVRSGVVMRTDSGGKGPALKRPLSGAEGVARFMIATRKMIPDKADLRIGRFGEDHMVRAYHGGRCVFALVCAYAADGVAEIFAISDPTKLRGEVVPPVRLSRL